MEVKLRTCKLTVPLTVRRMDWNEIEEVSFMIILPSNGSFNF